MSIKFDSLKPGDILWRSHRVKMGNTTMSRTVLTAVKIVTIDLAGYSAQVLENCRTKTVDGSYLTKLARNPPEWVRIPFDGDKCHLCYAKKENGHRETCPHPKAVAARKKASKQPKE